MICFPKNVWLWKNRSLLFAIFQKKLLEKIWKNLNEFEKFEKPQDWKFEIRFEGKIFNISIRSIRKIFNSIDLKVLFKFEKFEKN